MKIWAVTMVCNEEDIIVWNVGHLLSQGVDGVLVADNMSTDKTPDILSSMALWYQDKIRVVQDNEVGYYQSRKMTNLANFAHNELGADFIIPFDADELWYSMNSEMTVGMMIRHHDKPVIGVPMWNHYQCKEDGNEENPFARMRHRDSKQNVLDKVAFLWVPGIAIGQGNHNLYTNGQNATGEAIGLGIRHFPYRSAEHFLRKIEHGEKAYTATTLPENMGAHWRSYGQSLRAHGREAMIDHYKRWFTDECPGMELVFDPAPYKGSICPTE